MTADPRLDGDNAALPPRGLHPADARLRDALDAKVRAAVHQQDDAGRWRPAAGPDRERAA